MKKIFDFFKNINSLYLYLIILLLCFISIIMTTLFVTKKTVVTKKVTLISNEEKVEAKQTVKVDVKGNVQNPGVFELEEGSRVIDAINVAGGLKDDSNTDLINLSMKLKDEMTIIVYTNKEIRDYKENNKKTEYVYIEVEKCPDNINDACINKNTSSDSTQTSDTNTLISINTASSDELQTLPGIGKSKANDIISYRETNGNFSALEDIKKVSGIGDALFEKIKDLITV